jgi:hypothetical protein
MAFTGTSSAALQKIAADCGLQYDGVNTNDSMNWLLARKPYASLARQIADHGYVDKNSMMALGLTSEGVLKYRDLSQLVKQAAIATVNYGAVPSDGSLNVPILGEPKFKTKSGLLNSIFKYGTRVVKENLNGTADTYTKTNITLLSNNLDINTGVYDQLGNVRNEYAPPDGGNTHDNYRLAEHQNRQGLAAFATTIDVMCMGAYGLSLFDVVNFKQASSSGNDISQNYNGKYFIGAKTKYVSGTMYYEKYTLYGQGPSIDPNNGLIS